jgi:hypothetical protein
MALCGTLRQSGCTETISRAIARARAYYGNGSGTLVGGGLHDDLIVKIG